MRHFAIHWVLVTAVVSCAATSSLATPEQQPEALYRQYCGSCHGPKGKGDGVASSFMRPMPPDLTQMAVKAGGDFPFLAVMRAVDGREMARAHGDSEMPVWGEILSREAVGLYDAAGAEVQNKLLLITEYLRSIQQK